MEYLNSVKRGRKPVVETSLRETIEREHREKIEKAVKARQSYYNRKINLYRKLASIDNPKHQILAFIDIWIETNSNIKDTLKTHINEYYDEVITPATPRILMKEIKVKSGIHEE